MTNTWINKFSAQDNKNDGNFSNEIDDTASLNLENGENSCKKLLSYCKRSKEGRDFSNRHIFFLNNEHAKQLNRKLLTLEKRHT